MSDLEHRLVLLLDKIDSAVDRFQNSSEEIVVPSFCADTPDSLQRSRKHVEVDYAKLAEKMYLDRRKRDEIFSLPGVFGEPAWDMLLDLMIARLRGQKLSVTAVTQGCAAAPTTGLRYISLFESLGLIERSPDINDARRSWVKLTDLGYKKMSKFFDKVSSAHSISYVRALETGEIRLLSESSHAR